MGRIVPPHRDRTLKGDRGFNGVPQVVRLKIIFLLVLYLVFILVLKLEDVLQGTDSSLSPHQDERTTSLFHLCTMIALTDVLVFACVSLVKSHRYVAT